MTTPLELARQIATRYGYLSEVVAVTLAGSQTAGNADPGSDIDLYVYTRAEIPLAERERIASENASYAEVNNPFWEPGDEWIDAASGIHVDVMFRSQAWIGEQLDRVIRQHQASVGYSTCFWHNVTTSQILFEREGWFTAIQKQADQPYPDVLRRAIIAKNHPILRQTVSSYHYQIRRAVGRGDAVSVNHRVAAALASYFDILFAVNRLLHPGEKRLVAFTLDHCRLLPTQLAAQVSALLQSAGEMQGVIAAFDALLDGLDILLLAEGLW